MVLIEFLPSFAVISQLLPSRSVSAVKNLWHSHLQKSLDVLQATNRFLALGLSLKQLLEEGPQGSESGMASPSAISVRALLPIHVLFPVHSGSMHGALISMH
jgi:hypothetical protein